jgi:hypothetical protein
MTPATRRRTGRPTAFKPEYVDQVRKLCLLGATDAELADFFGVALSTLNNWKRSHPEFLDALKQGKIQADATVTERLYRRALGYSHKAVKILTVPRGANMGSDVVEHPYIERYPPDTTACIFWLKNRRPKDWRDRQPEAPPEDSDLTVQRLKAALDAMDAATTGEAA